jgi:hypothetical protein
MVTGGMYQAMQVMVGTNLAKIAGSVVELNGGPVHLLELILTDADIVML